MQPGSHKSDLSHETKALREAWMRHDDAFLEQYLVSSVEDPRIHFPSIFTRCLLVDWLFPGRFRELIWEEYRFGICMSYLHRVSQLRPSAGTFSLLLKALPSNERSFQSIEIPGYFLKTWDELNENSGKEQNFITQCLETDQLVSNKCSLAEDVLSTFQQRWKQAISDLDHDPVVVMEPACGSANDYRFFHQFGLDSLMDYHGFDICPKNISNAKKRFPAIRFEEGNVFHIAASDHSVDYLYTHDLFEHLSLDGMHQGLTEVCRVTKGLACLCFFNMAERGDHKIQSRDGYHWNRLSLERVSDFLRPMCRSMQVIHISGFLQQAFGCHDYHNPGAYAYVLDFGGN